MPRPKSWIPRIAEILQQLEAETAPDYTRSQVEQLFKLGADQATQLMEVAGYSERPQPGIGGRTSRTSLLFYVKNCREGQDAIREIERRQRLSQKLEAAKADLKLRKVELRVTKRDEWTSFTDLTNVEIKPGVMQVVFTPGNPIELISTLFRFAKAVGNDFDEFQRMCSESDGLVTRAVAVENFGECGGL